MSREKNFVCVADFEARSRIKLSSMARAFYDSGSDDEVTLRENIEAYRRLKLRPRILQGVGPRHMSTTLLGERVDMPIGISPVGLNGFAWPGGEIHVAKAAQAKGACYVLSSVAHTTIEEIAKAGSNAPNWFQLYISKNRAITEKVVRMVEDFGYKALVLTADVPALGHRRATIREPMVLPPHLRLPLFPEDSSRGVPGAGAFDQSISWADLHWLKSICKLPIIVKGVMTGEDAARAVQEGVAAVWVSNHGGRQLDTSLATIEVLPEIVSAVKGRAEIYVDGGIRNGTDVLKAIALGARAVFIGRPAIWGLACQGQPGVESVLEILKEEFSTAMAIAGCTTLDDISPKLVTKHSNYIASQL